ncbi:MAG: FAD-dependent oxidoreductase [Mariprofundales bacterium]
MAIIGGGIAGISAAIHLAEAGVACTLIEAGATLGGRASSFREPNCDQWIDHGPHLVMGCYHHLLGLLARASASSSIRWQHALSLPLWSADRGHFNLSPSSAFPISIALPLAIGQLPGHNHRSALALLRLATRPPSNSTKSVQQWLQQLRVPPRLVEDLLEPLCLGSMNEAVATADSTSFCHLLTQAFANHHSARLGWFRQPLSQGLIAPLQRYAEHLGVTTLTQCCVKKISQSDAGWRIDLGPNRPPLHCPTVILALPPRMRDRLLARSHAPKIHSGVISNLHLWFDQQLQLPHPLIGGIGTLGQWFFDIDAMTSPSDANCGHHYCVTISADEGRQPELLRRLCDEFSALSKTDNPTLTPHHWRLIRMEHATHLVKSNLPAQSMPQGIIDACEQPQPGDLPATLEAAVMRGQRAVYLALDRCQ